ncbi:RNA-binding protein 42 isoform X2 [Clupea harengus]|uniref:RNA-binding protein 42 n=1 Tax=Clupea harengus TaxID=7950 RepID=A0A6P8GB24_CLUHA|nr:RNA-binding protein 42 isoform X2 [Clupea harengus]
MALKSGEERLKEMEAEMALFEQEVLGGPVAVTPGGPTVDGVPMALTVPMIRSIIGTNTYQQVQQTLDARAATLGPPPAFVGPVPPVRPPPPMMRPAFVPHILQRPVGHRMPMMRGPPPQGMMAPPLPRPPPPPPMMLAPPMSGPPQHSMGPIGPPMEPMNSMPHGFPRISQQVGGMGSMGSPSPRPVPQPPPKATPSVIQAAPTVYTAPPAPKRPDLRAQRQKRMEELAALVAEQQAAAVAAGLLEAKKEAAAADESVIGPSMPEPEPVHTEPADGNAEDKKKGRQEKVKKCIRTAAGTSWEDQSLLEWESDDFRIFCGDLGNEVNDDILARAFSRYPSFLKAKVVRDKRTGKTKGYGFVSFKDPNDYVRAMREMNGKYVGSRPIKLRKSMWKDRNMEVVRKKQKEKKKLGLR